MRRKAVVEDLLREVVQGRLRPGDHLVTRALADRFGVSHTPIREALIALAGIGVVDLLPNRGAVVRPVSPDEVREICQVRRALECEAVRGACGRIDPAELSVLGEAFRGMIARTSPFPANVIEEAREHLAIVEALLAGDRRSAVKAMSEHIMSGSRYWCRTLPEAKTAVPRANGRIDSEEIDPR